MSGRVGKDVRRETEKAVWRPAEGATGLFPSGGVNRKGMDFFRVVSTGFLGVT
jgi:hypothetical protein